MPSRSVSPRAKRPTPRAVAATVTESVEVADRGARARERLLDEASKVFAHKGYAAASTREICQQAGMNVAAINYHFGGKEELYREVLLVPMREISARWHGFDAPGLSLAQSLAMLLGAFLPAPGDAREMEREARMMRLHLREMVEPSALYAELTTEFVRPHHEAITRLLARHIGLRRPDDAVQQLVFALVAMAQDYCMSGQLIAHLAPRLMQGPHTAPQVLQRLVQWGCVLVADERERRVGRAGRIGSKARTSPSKRAHGRAASSEPK